MQKRLVIRVFSLILTLSTVLAGFSLSFSAEDAGEFVRWKQADPRWNREEAWTEDEYPLAQGRTLAEAGDQVTALAMLLMQHGLVTDENFTPWQCFEALQKADAFDAAGKLQWNRIENAFPRLHLENRVEYSWMKVSALCDYGHPCILELKGRDGHLRYVTLRSAANYNVHILDPGSPDTLLTEADHPEAIYYFSIRSENPGPELPEYAKFPAPVMEVTQLGYESYSHAISNAIDIIPHGTMIAPFRCTVTFTDPSWGYVVLQSTGKVLYADGTLDYMTVSMVHSEDIGEMVRAQKEGRIICQGEPIYQAGGMGRWDPKAYRDHVHLAAYRGHVSAVTPDHYYGCGDVYPYDAFLIDPQFTTAVHGRGEGYKSTDSFMYQKAPWDYRGFWKTADGRLFQDFLAENKT